MNYNYLPSERRSLLKLGALAVAAALIGALKPGRVPAAVRNSELSLTVRMSKDKTCSKTILTYPPDRRFDTIYLEYHYLSNTKCQSLLTTYCMTVVPGELHDCANINF